MNTRTHTPINVAAAVLDAQARGDEPCSAMLTYLEATVSIDADGNVHVTIEDDSLAHAVTEMLKG
jgi:hypothetical protein